MTDENSPSDEENQEQDTSKTLAPPAEEHEANSWLDQFDAFKDAAMRELLDVAGQGLTELESNVLIHLAAKLVLVAEKHDPLAVEKLLELLPH